MAKRYEPQLPTAIMNMPYEVDETEREVEIEYDYEPYDPGDAWCPPSGGCVEIMDEMYVVVKKGHNWVRTGEVLHFSDLPADDQERWEEQVNEEGAEAEAEAKAMRKCRPRYGKYGRHDAEML